MGGRRLLRACCGWEDKKHVVLDRSLHIRSVSFILVLGAIMFI